MVARADITHVDRGAVSRVAGRGTFRMGRGVTLANSPLDIDARLLPLSLVTVGRFAPAMGLRGSATGPIRLTGTMRSLAVRTDLGFPDGGTASLTGNLDLASVQKGYDVSLQTHLFNANAIIAKAPRTSVSATATAVGRGLDPATMNARLAADIQSSSYDTLAIDSMKVRVSAANGMATVDTLAVGVPEDSQALTGTFGLRRGRAESSATTSRSIRCGSWRGSFQRAGRRGAPRPGILRKRVSRAQVIQRAHRGRAPKSSAQ